jgi:hypothetical protein
MERETEQHEAAGGNGTKKERGRGWTRRLTGPVQYRRYTSMSNVGAPCISFEFSLPPGQDRLDDAIFAVMKAHQTHQDGYPSHLTCRKNGTLWSMPDHEHNRGLADRIDMVLQDLASKLERNPGQTR